MPAIKLIWSNLRGSPPIALAVLTVIICLFIVAIIAGVYVVKTKYKIPTTDDTLTIDLLVINLRSEANRLATKLQKRVRGYTVLNFVLVMIEILGSLFFAVTGLHNQFVAYGQDVNKIAASPILVSIMGVAILLAGSLKAGFQPNTRKVEYGDREWLLSNTINEAEAAIRGL